LGLVEPVNLQEYFEVSKIKLTNTFEQENFDQQIEDDPTIPLLPSSPQRVVDEQPLLIDITKRQ
jgi:hypothetical protein